MNTKNNSGKLTSLRHGMKNHKHKAYEVTKRQTKAQASRSRGYTAMFVAAVAAYWLNFPITYDGLNTVGLLFVTLLSFEFGVAVSKYTLNLLEIGRNSIRFS